MLTYLKKKKVNKIEIDQGSFRDPAGRIFYYNEKVLRLLNKEGEKRYNFLKKKKVKKDITF